MRRNSEESGSRTNMCSENRELIVLKVGTSTLLQKEEDGSQRVRIKNVSALVELIVNLRNDGKDVVLVSSGAVGMGMIKLKIAKPTSLRVKQAVAATGQSSLMRMYEDLFSTVGISCAQLLINQSDFMDKVHWRNVKHTLIECLKLGVVPIINENDSTNTEELRFGDNDNLAALTAVQLEADWLFLFTDVDYLYTANPRTNPDAEALTIVKEPWSLKVDTAEMGTGFGTGGMTTKIVAARTASTAGIPCGMINGSAVERVSSFLKYDAQSTKSTKNPEPIGTFFMALDVKKVDNNRRWILSLPVAGTLVLDDGAARAVANHKSLLPAGVKKVEGQFTRLEAVKLMHRGGEVGRALVNFSALELSKIQGKHSSEFEKVLEATVRVEACDRSNIILIVDRDALRSHDVVGKLPSSPAQVQNGYPGGCDVSASEDSEMDAPPEPGSLLRDKSCGV